MNQQDAISLLMIEDNEQSARLVQKVLIPHGYIIHHAKTGLAGLQLARQVNPKLILLDMGLPDLDGKVIANQLRGTINQGKRPLVVAFTAETGPRARRMALAFGCDEFISKPIDVHAFPDQIALILKMSYSEGKKS